MVKQKSKPLIVGEYSENNWFKKSVKGEQIHWK